MLTFRIRVPAVGTYYGIFATPRAAQADAAQRWPDAHPASVVRIGCLPQWRAA